MVDLRTDGHAALDWAADYLERVGDLPVLAQVAPGDIRAAAARPCPRRARAVLRRAARPRRDPPARRRPTGSTRASSPTSPPARPSPAILAELLAATLNSVGFLWRTAPAATELEGVVLDWMAELLGLPGGWHGHIEDTASTGDDGGDDRRPRDDGPRRGGLLRAHPLGRREGRADARHDACARSPPTIGSGCDVDELGDLGQAALVVATVGTTASAVGRSRARDRRRLRAPRARGCTSTPPTPAAAMVCPEFRWAFDGVRARRLARRQPAQVDAHADGLLAAVDPPPGGAARRLQPRARSSCARPTPRTRCR